MQEDKNRSQNKFLRLKDPKVGVALIYFRFILGLFYLNPKSYRYNKLGDEILGLLREEIYIHNFI